MSDADEGSERLHELAIDAWLHAIATTSKKACKQKQILNFVKGGIVGRPGGSEPPRPLPLAEINERITNGM